jgi:hypothetical protein
MVAIDDPRRSGEYVAFSSDVQERPLLEALYERLDELQRTGTSAELRCRGRKPLALPPSVLSALLVVVDDMRRGAGTVMSPI